MIIAWPTHNRAESVLRSVKSFNDLKSDLQFTVSNTGESKVAPLFYQNNINVDLWESENRASWINQLKESCKRNDIKTSLIDFSLTPEAAHGVVTTGANRNFLLLKLVGKKFISVDDDALFDVRRLTSEH